MKTLIASIALGFSLAVTPAFGADEAPAKKKDDAPVKKKMVFTEKRSMSVDSGRYHKLHAKLKKLECDDCHDKEQKDILYLRKDDRMSKKLAEQGQVDREGCLECHKPGHKPGDKPSGTSSFWGV
jgi:nitrate/TMAO reductase-like tetraheme cytochrome c subunit